MYVDFSNVSSRLGGSDAATVALFNKHNEKCLLDWTSDVYKKHFVVQCQKVETVALHRAYTADHLYPKLSHNNLFVKVCRCCEM